MELGEVVDFCPLSALSIQAYFLDRVPTGKITIPLGGGDRRYSDDSSLGAVADKVAFNAKKDFLLANSLGVRGGAG